MYDQEKKFTLIVEKCFLIVCCEITYACEAWRDVEKKIKEHAIYFLSHNFDMLCFETSLLTVEQLLYLKNLMFDWKT